MRMKTLLNHSQDGWLLKMIRRTDPVITDMGPVTSEGYPRGAKTLADWIWREFGKPTKFYNDTYDFIKNNSKTGIFFLDGPNGFADHIDIWNGKKSGSGIYKSIKVWFWEIK